MRFRFAFYLMGIWLCTFITYSHAEHHQELHIRQANGNLQAYAAYKMGEYDRAFAIWQRLAKQGNTTAMNNLANMYEQGQGIAQDTQQSIYWLTKSAQSGNSVAQVDLAYRYEQGAGVTRNLQSAEKWFRRAMLQEEAEAFFALGVMRFTNYGKGNPTSKQMHEARELLQQAHKAGHREATTYLPLIEAQLPQ